MTAGGTKASPGDFGARLVNDRLLVPEALERALQELSIGDVEEFLSYLSAFPSAVAAALRWDPSEVEVAYGRLLGQLRGHVAKEILDLPEPDERVLGAFDPTTAKR